MVFAASEAAQTVRSIRPATGSVSSSARWVIHHPDRQLAVTRLGRSACPVQQDGGRDRIPVRVGQHPLKSDPGAYRNFPHWPVSALVTVLPNLDSGAERKESQPNKDDSAI